MLLLQRGVGKNRGCADIIGLIPLKVVSVICVMHGFPVLLSAFALVPVNNIAELMRMKSPKIEHRRDDRHRYSGIQ
jgi:hypothetical protein